MHMKQLKMLFQVIQISSLNKGVLNSYNNYIIGAGDYNIIEDTFNLVDQVVCNTNFNFEIYF